MTFLRAALLIPRIWSFLQRFPSFPQLSGASFWGRHPCTGYSLGRWALYALGYNFWGQQVCPEAFTKREKDTMEMKALCQMQKLYWLFSFFFHFFILWMFIVYQTVDCVGLWSCGPPWFYRLQQYLALNMTILIKCIMLLCSVRPITPLNKQHLLCDQTGIQMLADGELNRLCSQSWKLDNSFFSFLWQQQTLMTKYVFL